MRQELAFLVHLTRLIGQEPEPGYGRRRCRRQRRLATRAARLPRPRPPGLSLMPISSFYGLQTSLRGLLAQQRLLDTTGHNIANASTRGYSRQEAVARRPRRRCRSRPAASPAAPARTSAPASTSRASAASATSSSTRSTARQNTNLSEWTARADRARPGRARARRAGRQRHQRPAARSSGTPGRTSPTQRATTRRRQAGGRRAGRGAGRRVQHRPLADRPGRRPGYAQYTDLARPASPATRAARSRRSRPSIAGLNDDDQALRHGRRRPERPARPPRPAARPALRVRPDLGRRPAPDGSINVSLRRQRHVRDHLPDRDRRDRRLGRPAGRRPGRPAASSAACSTPPSPGGTLDGYLSTLDTIANSLASTVNGAYGGAFFDGGAGPTGATIDVVRCADPGRARRRSPPAPARPAPTTSRSRSRSCAAAPASTAPTSAFVAQVGGDLNEATRRQANAQVLTDAVEDRRQSVAGVSMDEEMSNLVRFQRAYQASARAMSHDGRDARRPDQPHRTGGSLMSMRITTSMVQRNVLAGPQLAV